MMNADDNKGGDRKPSLPNPPNEKEENEGETSPEVSYDHHHRSFVYA